MARSTSNKVQKKYFMLLEYELYIGKILCELKSLCNKTSWNI